MCVCGVNETQIDTKALNDYCSTLDLAKLQSPSTSHRPAFPLKFTNQSQEINFYAVLDVLNFGSGYRKELHQLCRRGAYDTITFGLIAMHLSGVVLNSDFLVGIKVMDVQNYFGIPIDQEFEVSKGVCYVRWYYGVCVWLCGCVVGVWVLFSSSFFLLLSSLA